MTTFDLVEINSNMTLRSYFQEGRIVLHDDCEFAYLRSPRIPVLDHPEAVAVPLVPGQLSRQPQRRTIPVQRIGIEAHHLRISQQPGKEVQVIRYELTEEQPGGPEDGSHDGLPDRRRRERW